MNLQGLTEYTVGNNLNRIKLHHMILEGENPFSSDDIKRKFTQYTDLNDQDLAKKQNPSGIAYPEQFSKHTSHTKGQNN